MTNDEQRVAGMAVECGGVYKEILQLSYIRMSAKNLLAFEQECIKRAGLEVLALREFARDCAMNWDCDSDAHKYGTPCRVCDAQEVLTNTEASAKRIKAGNAAEVLEESATVVTETYSDYDGNSLPCFETVGECADKLKAMAEERRAIAKGEK